MAIDASNQEAATTVTAIWQGLFGTAPPSLNSLENFTARYEADPAGFVSFLSKTQVFTTKFVNEAGQTKEFALIIAVYKNAGLFVPSLQFIQNQSKLRDGNDLLDFLLSRPAIQASLNVAASDFVEKVVDGQPVAFGVSLDEQPVNTAPTNITISADTYDEATPISATVATLTADDAEGHDVTFTLLNDASVPFTIIDGNKVIVDASLEDADFDDETFILQVQATDEFGAVSDVTEITVTVTDDDEEPVDPPMFINLSPGAATLVGGDNDDTFTGSSSSLANPSATTADAGDRLLGGEGDDTFFLAIDGPNPVNVDGITLDSVETIDITNNSPHSANVVATDFDGTTTFVNSGSQGSLSIEDVQYEEGQTFVYEDPNDTGQTFTVDFDANELPADGSGEVTLVLDEVGTNGGAGTNFDVRFTQGAATGTTAPAMLANLNIESINGPNFLDDLNTGAMKFTISGDADLQLGDENDNDDDLLDDNAALMEIDASALDANLTVELDDDSGSDDTDGRAIRYTGAIGDDRVQMGNLFDDGNNSKDNSSEEATEATKQVFDGGPGNNTLVFENFTNIGAGDDLNGVVMNFQTAEFQEEVGDNGEEVLYADQLDGVRTFVFADGVHNHGSVEVVGLDADQTHTFVVEEDNNNSTGVDMDFDVGDPDEEAATGTDINGTMDSIVVTLNDDDLAIALSGDEIEMFEFQVLDGSSNEVVLQEPMTDLTLVKLTDLEPITAGTFTFDGALNIVQPSFLYDGSMSAIDQVVSGVNLGTVITGSGDDDVTGTEDDNVIITNDGDDTVEAGEGDDFVDAGPGNDFVDGGRGDDTILGGDDDDTLIGGSGNDYIDGGAGKDIMTGGTGIGPFGAEPRIVKFSVEGLVGLGDGFTIDLFHDLGISASYVAGAADVGNPGNIAAALAADLLANGAVAEGYTVTAMGNMVTVTRLDGEDFLFDSGGTDGAAADLLGFDTAMVTLDDSLPYDQFDIVSISIDGNPYSYTVVADGETAADVAAGLAASINGGTEMTATIDPGNPNKINLVGNVQAVNYTVALLDVVPLPPNVDDGVSPGIDNMEAIPATIVIDAQGEFENPGDSYSLTIIRADGTGSDNYSVTQTLFGPLSTSNGALNALVTAEGNNILASMGLAGTDATITVVGDDIIITGPSDGSPIPVGPADVTVNLTDGVGDPIDTASVTFTDGDPVNDNNAPTVTDNVPAPIQDNGQTVTALVIDEGEPNGADTFVVDSPNVDPFDFVGDEIDMITDFETAIDTLVFDGATLDGFDDLDNSGGLSAGDLLRFFDLTLSSGPVGTYQGAFIAANAAMMADPTVDYVSVEVLADGNTYIFADVNGDNSVDQAVQLMGSVTITAEDIKADVFGLV